MTSSVRVWMEYHVLGSRQLSRRTPDVLRDKKSRTATWLNQESCASLSYRERPIARLRHCVGEGWLVSGQLMASGCAGGQVQFELGARLAETCGGERRRQLHENRNHDALIVVQGI